VTLEFEPRRPFILPKEGEVCDKLVYCAACGATGDAQRAAVSGRDGTTVLWQEPTRWYSTVPGGALVCPECHHRWDWSRTPCALTFASKHLVFVHWENGRQVYKFIEKRDPEFVVLERAPLPEKEEKEMSRIVTEDSKPGVKERLVEHGSLLGGALLDGAKLAAVNEMGEVFLDIARRAFKDNKIVSAALDDPDGRALVLATTAVLVHELAMEAPQLVPRADLVAIAARKQLTATSYNVLHEKLAMLRVLLVDLAPALDRLATAGETIKGLPAATKASAENVEREAARS